MDYSDWNNEPFLIDAGSLASHTIQQQFQQQFQQQLPNDGSSNDNLTEGYNYKDLLGKAYKQYSALGNLMVKKDAAITFTTIGAIGLSLLCINSLIIRILFLAVASILSFDLELQIPCASILLSLFVFREHNMSISKALLLILSLTTLVYAYWAESLINYSDIVWWMNIFIVVLWVWLVFNASSSGYYKHIIEFAGGNVLSPYDGITECDIISEY
jgi:hypothetical protein